jgi:glycosyltransferase involved in cell wall biosynthesis
MQRGIGFFSEFSSLLSLMHIMRTFQPDLVHANSSKAGVLAPIAANLTGIHRNIFTSHGWAFNETHSASKKIAYRIFHYIGLFLSDTVICVSEAIKRDVERWPFIASKLTVIHLGVESIDLIPKDEARAALMPDWLAMTWIGCVARLDPVKQLDVLIRAFGAIASRFPDARLIILGEGSLRHELEALIKELSLEGRVALPGYREHAQRYMRAFDMTVLPSLSESFGFVLAESGLASVPVIASDVGGVPEIITNGQTGVLVPSGDSTALAAAFEKLLSDISLRKRLGDALYEKVLRDFTKGKMIEKTFALYSD